MSKNQKWKRQPWVPWNIKRPYADRVPAKSYDIYNKNGDIMCNAVGCRKHKRISEAYGARWCYVHLQEIKLIREMMKNDGSVEDLMARTAELALRKDNDSSNILTYYMTAHTIILQSGQEITYSPTAYEFFTVYKLEPFSDP